MQKVKDHIHWVRDDNGVLINNDANDYQAYLKKKQAKMSEVARINDMQTQINNLNNKLDTILSLLQSK